MHEPALGCVQRMEDPAQGVVVVARKVVVTAYGVTVPPAGFDAFGLAKQGDAGSGNRLWSGQQPQRAQAFGNGGGRSFVPRALRLASAAVLRLDLSSRRLERFTPPGIKVPNWPVVDARRNRLRVADFGIVQIAAGILRPRIAGDAQRAHAIDRPQRE